MKLRSQVFARVASVSSLALTFICGISYAQSNTPLSGAYGFVVSESFIKTDGEKGLTFVGVMNLDGTGNVTASVAFQNGAGPNHPSQTGQLTLTGNYSTKPDGTGSLTLGIPGDLTFTLAMVLTDGGQSIQMVTTKCSVGADTCGPATGVYTAVARAVNGGAASLKGSYGFQLNTAPLPASTVGVLTFDGVGNATMSFTRVGVDATSPVSPTQTGTMSGTYSLNSDGTGAINVKDASGQINSFAFVVTDGGSGLLLIQTRDGAPDSTVSFGSARLQ